MGGEYYGLSERQALILCIMIRKKCYGGATIDYGTLKRNLPQEYQNKVKEEMDKLEKKGFLKSKPKQDDRVYSIAPERPVKRVLHEIKDRVDDIWSSITEPEEEEYDAKEFIHPILSEMIETTISNSPLVSLRGLSTSEEKDENFPEYYKAKLHLEIVCPKTRENILPLL